MSQRTLKLGGFELSGAWLAPLAGYTDIAFRKLCKRFGAALTITEMVSVRGLVRGNAATETLLRLADNETPSCVQLFGNDPDEFARAAKTLDCDIINVNMGCPMPKIVKNGDGAALLKTPETAGAIVGAIVDCCDKPVTVKTRLGYDMGDRRAYKLIENVEKAGAAAVIVHGRYAEERYAGQSDVSAVKEIASSFDIPVIYNGDVSTENTEELSAPPFAGVMIGRAALENPGIFDGSVKPAKEYAREHLKLLTEYFDERYTVNACRKFFIHYFKGVKGGKAVRTAVNAATTAQEIWQILDNFGA